MSTTGPRVALMQPTFLPWVGYLDLLRAADIFVVLDDFQFVRRSFHQRNRLFVAPGRTDWVSVSVEHQARDATLAEVAPHLHDVRTKLRGVLRHVYARAPFAAALVPEVEAWLGRDYASLADLNVAFLALAARWLDISTPLVRSSSLGSTGARSARIADLLRRVGARTYLSARGAAGYMVTDGVFPLPDIEVVFQDHAPAPYAQVQSPTFVPYLSVLDALLQVGPEATRRVLEEGRRPFVPWSAMLAHVDGGHTPDDHPHEVT